MAAKEIAACQHADCGVERVRIGHEQSPQRGLNLHPLSQSLENLRPLILVAWCLVAGCSEPVRGERGGGIHLDGSGAGDLARPRERNRLAAQLPNVGQKPECGLGGARDPICTHVERLLADLCFDEPVRASPKEKVRILSNGFASDVLHESWPKRGGPAERSIQGKERRSRRWEPASDLPGEQLLTLAKLDGDQGASTLVTIRESDPDLLRVRGAVDSDENHPERNGTMGS